MNERVRIRFKYRPHQLELRAKIRRFSVFVCHRRFGKTFFALSRMLEEASATNRPDWRGYYVAPTYKQAKKIAWDYLVKFTAEIPGIKRNVSDLSVSFPNGARITLLGVESYDTLRGLYADRVVLDETALIPSAALTQVILPMLADRSGALLAIGTPAGRMNLFWELLEEARAQAAEGADDWSHAILPVSETGIVSADELKRQRRLMSPEEYQQEFECSFNAAIRGAYYAREMEALEQGGRFTAVTYQRQFPVTAALDLGWSDAMVAIFSQTVGTEEHLICARAWERTAIPEMLDDWADLPFPVSGVILPHDAKVRELGTGLSREQVFQARGLVTHLVPNQSIHEGIHAVRELLPHVWMDRIECATLREALVAYRADYDEVRRVFRTKPLHDWSSHWADAMRYLALGRGMVAPWKPRGRLNRGGR